MAGSVSSFGLSNALNLPNGVVSGSGHYLIPDDVRLKTLVKEVTSLVRDRRGAVKRLRLVVRFQHSQAEPQWGVAATTRVKDEGARSAVARDTKILEKGNELETDIGGNGGDVFYGSGGNGTFYSGGSGSSGDGEGENIEEEEFGLILKFDEVLKEAEARGARLPSDMLEAAKSVGIRKVLLLGYLDLQGSGGLLGFAMKSCSMLRNRMLADPSFLFKIGTEVWW